ncbi:MAG: HlyD family efflux transporter periplasmic adaptor subunit [Burkholderiales bacterium]|nr:HlyD family efflux transporter periplasmic adaptor subunit [Burkholderiales bacterium]
METLGNLLQIEQDIRQAQSERAVEFIAVNDTWRVMPYRQASLWRSTDGQQPSVKIVSGLADLPGDSPFRQWLDHAIAHVMRDAVAGKPQLVTADSLPDELRDGWQEWMPEHVLSIAFPTPIGGTCGGLWIAVESPPGEAELALLERLSWAYGQALWAWRPHTSVWQRWRVKIKDQSQRKLLWLALLAVALFPMHLTVLAPAEITGKDAKLIGAPMDGVVAKFFVKPNALVKAGNPVFTLEDTVVRNRNEVALKSLAVARADYLRETQKSFDNDNSKAELPAFNAKFEEKAAEARYSADLLRRAVVTAPEDGIVVYSDPNDWLGKPVQTGERIVQIADPKRVEISISLPVSDALNLEPGAKVKLYLNASPFDTVEGVLTQSSYEPILVPEGFVAYRLKADILPGEAPPRIGLKGTAKIYGAWSPLIYHLLRKPLSVLRRTFGV